MTDLSEMPKGFQLAGVRCGLKNKRNDLGLIISSTPAKIAGVLTTNHVRASCVDHTRQVVHNEVFRGLIVNSGNANCCTGEQGVLDTQEMATLVASRLGCELNEVAVASTGVIGQLIDMSKVRKGVEEAFGKLGPDPKPFKDAILTTDLVEKEAFASLAGGGVMYGVAKGSGMLAPNMATMLAFVMTDADCSGIDLQAVIKRVSARTFDRVSVDSDTSTNDMFLLIANGASKAHVSTEELENALMEVSLSLAKQIAKDGEGATKLITVTVQGSKDPYKIARSIAESPLVKTAMYGCDPNWGRIMMAAGKCGVPIDQNKAVLSLVCSGETHVLYEDGSPAAFDAVHVAAGLKSDQVEIFLDLGPGQAESVYTCDFSYGYIRINSEYHT